MWSIPTSSLPLMAGSVERKSYMLERLEVPNLNNGGKTISPAPRDDDTSTPINNFSWPHWWCTQVIMPLCRSPSSGKRVTVYQLFKLVYQLLNLRLLKRWTSVITIEYPSKQFIQIPLYKYNFVFHIFHSFYVGDYIWAISCWLFRDKSRLMRHSGTFYIL